MDAMNTQDMLEIVLAATPDAPLERIQEAENFIAFLKETAKEGERLLNNLKIERIKATGPFMLGTRRIYLGQKPTYKVRNASEAFQLILEAVKGDEEKLIGCLASGWLKHGEVRTLMTEAGMPALFDKIFKTNEEDEVREGKPVREKKLMTADTRFIR